MAKKTPPVAADKSWVLVQLDAVVERLSALDAKLNQIDLDLQPLRQLAGAHEATKQLALEALAQAQDALTTGQLVRAHEDRLTTLTLAVAEGIAHVDRAEARIRATVGRARRELRDAGVYSPGVEAEATELRDLDGTSGDGEELPPVPARVAPTPPAGDPLEAQLRALKLWNRA